jgi:YggT family protein
VDVGDLLDVALRVYLYILFARILLSWMTMFWTPPPALTPVIRVIYELTEPIMAYFRRFIPPIGGFDLSPLIIFFIISILRNVVATSL